MDETITKIDDSTISISVPIVTMRTIEDIQSEIVSVTTQKANTDSQSQAFADRLTYLNGLLTTAEGLGIIISTDDN